MTSEKIYLYEDRTDVYLEVMLRTYSDEVAMKKRPAMLVCPGGGYGMCSDREAEPIACAFLASGFHAFVLRYSVSENASLQSPEFSQPLLDASLAMKIIRDNAEKWNVDSEKVAVIGFSAGGHLAGSLGTLWHEDYIYKKIDMPYGYNKPSAMILCYPVLSGGEFAHRGSFNNLYGSTEQNAEFIKRFSLELCVSDKTVPTFLWHTAEDGAVPVENSLLFSMALSKENIPFELHVFPKGGHGMSLATAEVGCDSPYVARWIGFAKKWLEETL